MAGTKTGGLKAAQKNLARDPDFYAKIGRKGGKMVGLVALPQIQLWLVSLALRADAFHAVLKRQYKKLQNKTAPIS